MDMQVTGTNIENPDHPLYRAKSLNNNTDHSFRRPIGPKVPPSSPRVVFRIKGEKVTRAYEPMKMHDMQPSSLQKLSIPEAVDKATQFVDMRCRPLLRLNGYNPADRSYKSKLIVSSEVDFYYCDHPLLLVNADNTIHRSI
jgi:hypothetical protein